MCVWSASVVNLFWMQFTLSLFWKSLDKCTTLWGEPEQVYVQKVEQLHVLSECNWTSGHWVSHKKTRLWGLLRLVPIMLFFCSFRGTAQLFYQNIQKYNLVWRKRSLWWCKYFCSSCCVHPDNLVFCPWVRLSLYQVQVGLVLETLCLQLGRVQTDYECLVYQVGME